MIDKFCSSGTGTWGFPGNVGPWEWIGFLLNLIFWVGFIAGLILLVVWAARRARVRGAEGEPTATAILQARYARGEITREQYRQMQQDVA